MNAVTLKSVPTYPEGMLMTDTELLAMYADYQGLRGFSPSTVRRRCVTLGMLAKMAAPAAIGDISTELVAEFLGRYPNLRTRHAYRSDISAFYSWACLRSLCPTNPVDMIGSVKMPRSLPRPIPAALVPSMVAAAHDPDTRLMVALAVYGGLRRAEIAALDAADVPLGAGVLFVRGGKGAKDRTIPLHPTLRLLLAGRVGPLFTVSPDTVGRRIKLHLATCGITATAHQLRHTFGTEMARLTGGDLLTVGDLMGHSSATTTMGYTALTGTRGAEAVAQLFERGAA